MARSVFLLLFLERESMATTDITIKLLIDTEANKVLFAEASKDFVDFLFFLLALPIGTVIKLLTSQSMVGSIGNLFTSFANLNETYLAQSIHKNVLLNPMIFSSTNTPLLISESSIISSGNLYTCRCSRRTSVTNVCDGASCSNCCQKMNRYLKFVAASENGTADTPVIDFTAPQGYVKEMVPYMVSDDLTVTPISTMSIISMTNMYNASKLEERKVNIGTKEAMELLKISFRSTTVLTDVFLGRKPGKFVSVKDGDVEELSAQFAKEMEEKIEELQSMEKLNKALITREHMSNEEIQDARKQLIDVFQMISGGTDVRLRKMGVILQTASMSHALVVRWRNNIMDSNWHPFKTILKEGKHQRVIDEEDSKLKELRTDWGREVYNVIVKALMERNEYNPTEQNPVYDLWNYKEGRKATLKEAIQCLCDELKKDPPQPSKSKRCRRAM